MIAALIFCADTAYSSPLNVLLSFRNPCLKTNLRKCVRYHKYNFTYIYNFLMQIQDDKAGHDMWTMLQLGWRVWEQSRDKLWKSGRQSTNCKSWKGALLSIKLIFIFCNQYSLKWLSFLPTYIEVLFTFINFKYWYNIFAASSKRCFCGLWSIFSSKL